MTSNPSVVLRLGSHSEKEYFEKLLRFYDGFIVAANLLENTPKATASLVHSFSHKTKSNVPYYIDPMTYVFGCYVDNQGRLRDDLDWIKSEKKIKGGTIFDFKSSYKSMSEKFGGPFEISTRNPRERHSAIQPTTFSSPQEIENTCRNILDYQENYVKTVLESSLGKEMLELFRDTTPLPAAVYAPYFYVEPSRASEWLELNLKFMTSAVGMGCKSPIHGVLCIDASSLLDSAFLKKIIDGVAATKVNGIWLWISKLNEDNQKDAQLGEKLFSLKNVVQRLSESMTVYNMHGGYFSMLLSKFGMAGISHGVGYGEQKDVVPVIGQAIPTVRYYLPDLHRRLGVTQIKLYFNQLGISKPEDFHRMICDCVICKGIVKEDVGDFDKFGEMNPPKLGSTRGSQTADAAKISRFHFLLNRAREKKFVRETSIPAILECLSNSYRKWEKFKDIKEYSEHIPVWGHVLDQ